MLHRWLIAYLPLLVDPVLPGQQVIENAKVIRALGLLLRVAEFHWIPETFMTREQYMDGCRTAAQHMMEFAKLAEMVSLPHHQL